MFLPVDLHPGTIKEGWCGAAANPTHPAGPAKRGIEPQLLKVLPWQRAGVCAGVGNDTIQNDAESSTRRSEHNCDVTWTIPAGGDVAAMFLAGFGFKPGGRLNRAGHPPDCRFRRAYRLFWERDAVEARRTGRDRTRNLRRIIFLNNLVSGITLDR